MKIIDNKACLLLNELNSHINANSNVYITSHFFTAFALYEMIDALKRAKGVKMLLDLSLQDKEAFKFLQTDGELALNYNLDRRYKVDKVVALINDKLEIRTGSLGGQNIIIVENAGVSTCYMFTPLELDSVCLGAVPSFQPCIINALEDQSNQYLDYFNSFWDKSKHNINAEIVKHFKEANRDFSPESIYKYSIREIFKYSTINERADEKLQQVGFKDSKVWSLLYNFQKDAVIGAIDKIETFGGCIIADSVGLGKTFEALGVIKYYQLRNSRILVLAPKKLRDNWTIYKQNDKRNILADDRLNYDVLNHTDLSREKGLSGDIDLRSINWGNYDLVVIDESHNFRNNPTKKGMSRYKRLMNDIIKANIKTKVLMLSATPVNNRMNDLKNQIAFITEGDDKAFQGNGIDSISKVMKDSQRRFTQWYRETNPNNYDANDLISRLDGNYFKILDMLTIARSRKHVEKYYDMADIGQFPERLQPLTIKAPIDTKSQFKDIVQLYDEISTLTLAAYTPLAYVRSDKREEYEAKYDMTTATGSVFKMVDREQSLIYLMRVNLLKRLESSIQSFKMTVDKLLQFVDANLQQIEKHENGELDQYFGITEIDIDDTELEDFLVGGKIKVLIQDVDIIRWRQDLQKDERILSELLSSISIIDAERDAKLQELKSIISDKIKHPLNGDNKKVIVFTAFADTANYLYQELAADLQNHHSLYSALVTGSGNNKTNMPNVKTDLMSVLTHFAPLAKKRASIYPDAKDEIDILICTDCISEGQNLQDCDYLINYDIHWNPVRIIQRFGRIDRIGSVNEKIQLVNFFPNMELDNFIDLVARVQGRMVMLDVSATGEDNVIVKNSKEMQDLDYRKRQLKQLQNQVIDLEDVQGSISITDLTFNDFKIDLEKSSGEEIEALQSIPPASYAVVKSNLEEIKAGAIFCLKDLSEEDQHYTNNIIYPYFLVYVSKDGETLVKATRTKKALDYFRKLCMGQYKTLPLLIEAFAKETKQYKVVETYAALLRKAMNDVSGVQEQLSLDTLLNAEGSSLAADSAKQGGDLELVSYLIIK